LERLAQPLPLDQVMLSNQTMLSKQTMPLELLHHWQPSTQGKRALG